MKQAPQPIHWLARVAVKAGLDGSDRISLRVRTPPNEAWSSVQQSCGISLNDLAAEIARQYGVKVADLNKVELGTLKLLPEKVARRFHVFPLREDHGRLIVATSDPTNLLAEQAVGFAAGRTPVFEIAPPAKVQEAINLHFAPDHLADSLISGVQREIADTVRVLESSDPEVITASETLKAPIIRLTNLILHDAIASGASDIHIEPELQGGCIRIRIDGLLRDYLKVPRPVLNRVVSRVKVLGGMDIADRLRPHNGRTRIQVASGDYDLRLSTVPTRDTEKAVIRILSASSLKGLDELGLEESELERLKHLFSQTDGLVIVTGPSGSGKTTTLYAAVKELTTGETNIMTVEDPVEYELNGVTQIQVAARRGVTFASSLRAILRQDPDVILVGEVRDLETAGIAVQASAAGHLVLSTLHTNDAVGVISRLSSLGIHPSAVASSFRGAVAQRLVRRVCTYCAETIETLTPPERSLSERYGVKPKVRAIGCEHCSQSGYRGRLSIMEIIVKDSKLEGLIDRDAPVQELVDAVRQAGMLPMLSMALTRVRDGLTTLEEVERVLGQHLPDARSEPRGPHILVVDANAADRNRIRSMLMEQGYRVTEALKAISAIEMLQKEHDFAMVISAANMPGFDGREFLIRLRSSIRTVGLPVIVTTDETDSELELGLMEAGASDYIRKPFVEASFLKRVQATLDRAESYSATSEVSSELGQLMEKSEPSLAVLPFEDLSARKDQQYFCDGLAEELTEVLGRLGGIRVLGRTSAFSFRGKDLDLQAVGRELGVGAILQGSVRKSADRVEIATRLVSVDDNFELWSDRFERELGDVFEVEERISRAVADKLDVTLLAPETRVAERATGDSEAYELYLKGRSAWNERTEEGLKKSVELFTQAIDKDPEFDLCHAGLANAYATLGIYGALPPQEVMPLAREAAERALDLNSGSSDALTALGCVRAAYTWDWDADSDFEQAIEINPQNAHARNWFASNYLTPMGRSREAHLQMARAQRSDPLSPVIATSVGVQFYYDRRYDEAVAECLKALAMNPEFGIAHYFLGQAYLQQGNHADAITELERAAELTGRSPEVIAGLAHAKASLDLNEEAREILDELVRLSENRYVSPTLLAQVYVGLGESDAALEALEQAASIRATDLIWLKARPVFDPIRSEQRFSDLCARIFFAG